MTGPGGAQVQWLYERSPDNRARFVLGTPGANPLICVGINPSTAEPGSLDPTINLVERTAVRNGFDSFIMLNVYPQRATKPRDLHREIDEILKRENERHIARIVRERSVTLWAAWGGSLDKRKYLRDALRDIALLPELANANWVSRGRDTMAGHPHHPLYVKRNATLEPFSMMRYL
jgi:hypothetical protein